MAEDFEGGFVDCVVCGEPLSDENSDGTTPHGEPCHNHCAVIQRISELLGLVHQTITQARQEELINAEVEAALERHFRHAEDGMLDLFR